MLKKFNGDSIFCFVCFNSLILRVSDVEAKEVSKTCSLCITVPFSHLFLFVITRYYKLIAVKVNASFEKKSTNSYNNFKTYESAHFNEPYIAVVFNKSFVNDGFNHFTLGKMITNFVIFFWTIFLLSHRGIWFS